MDFDGEIYHHIDVLQMDGPHDVVFEEFDKAKDRDTAVDIGRGLYAAGYIVRVMDSRGRIEWES